MKRDLTKLRDASAPEIEYLLRRARYLKDLKNTRVEHKPLKDRTLAMIFEKASTRTRISFEVGMRDLGGHAIFLSSGETQIGRGEPVKDTARVLSRYVDLIMIRTFAQDTVEDLARWASVPVINGLSDLLHPCQILADLLTVLEFKGEIKPLKVAYVGDGNNIANSWIEASILLGFNLSIAAPANYGPDGSLVDEATMAGTLIVTNDPVVAVRDADVINTDVWASMGQEKEQVQRRRDFASFRIDEDLMTHAKNDAIVMHCLPAHRDEEISDGVFERFQEVIFTQAENRLHVQKALMEWLILGQY